jgi:hypothetical protein
VKNQLLVKYTRKGHGGGVVLLFCCSAVLMKSQMTEANFHEVKSSTPKQIALFIFLLLGCSFGT